MGKIFEIANGSFINNVDGTVGVPSGIEWVGSEKGLSLKALANEAKITFPITYSEAICTIAWGMKLPNNHTADSAILDILGQASGNDRIILNGDAIWMEIGVSNWFTFSSSLLPYKASWHFFEIIKNGADAYLYVDGILKDSLSVVGAAGAFEFTTIFGDDSATRRYDSLQLHSVRVWDIVLGISERAQLYSDFLNAHPTQKRIENNLSFRKADDRSSEEGLIASYNMKPSIGGVLVDTSGQGNTGNIVGAVSGKDGLVFNWEQLITLPEILLPITSGTASICIRYREEGDQSGVSRPLLGNDTKAYSLVELGASNALVLESDTNADSVLTAVLRDDKWHNLSICFTYGVMSVYVDGVESVVVGNPFIDDLTIDRIAQARNITFFKGEISDLAFYNYAFSEQQAKDYHNKFAKRTAIKDSFEDAAVEDEI